MKVICLGNGEAVDEKHPNNSFLLLSKSKLMLDCGFSAPYQLWKYNDGKDFLDFVYISHTHADHYFGLAALICRLDDEKREKQLTVICQNGSEKIIRQMINLGYPGKGDLTWLKFIEVNEGDVLLVNEFAMEFAWTAHSVRGMAIRIEADEKIICYSGDGMFTKASERLYTNSDLLIHESFGVKIRKTGHSVFSEVIAMAKKHDVKVLALTHFDRFERRKCLKNIKETISTEKEIKILLPEPMDEMNL